MAIAPVPTRPDSPAPPEKTHWIVRNWWLLVIALIAVITIAIVIQERKKAEEPLAPATQSTNR